MLLFFSDDSLNFTQYLRCIIFFHCCDFNASQYFLFKHSAVEELEVTQTVQYVMVFVNEMYSF